MLDTRKIFPLAIPLAGFLQVTACGPVFTVGEVSSDAGAEDTTSATSIDHQAVGLDAGMVVETGPGLTDAATDVGGDVVIEAPLSVGDEAGPSCAFNTTRCQGYVVQVCTAAGQWAASTTCLVGCCPPSQTSINGQLESSSPYCSSAGCTAPLITGHACGEAYITYCPTTGVCTVSGACP